MKTENIIELKDQGYTIIRNLIDDNWLDLLRDGLDKAFIEHRQTQLNNGNDIHTDGVALHVLLSNPIFISFLEELQNTGFFKFLSESFFDSKCIINSFSGLDNLPNQPNFSAIVHRDLRFYAHGLPIMVNCSCHGMMAPMAEMAIMAVKGLPEKLTGQPIMVGILPGRLPENYSPWPTCSVTLAGMCDG